MSDSDEELPLAARKQTAQTKPRPAVKTEPQQTPPSTKVKRETLEDDVPIIQKKAPANSQASSKAAPSAKAKVKSEPVSKAAPSSKMSSAKMKSDGKVKVEKEEEKVKREKKEYEMPGQCRETPPETDPLRKFYASLLEQMPGSELARKWCAQHGLLDRADAERWVEDNKLKKPGIVAKSPAKAGLTSRSSGSSLNNGTSKDKPARKPASSTATIPKPEANGKSSNSHKRCLNDWDDEKPLAKKAKPPLLKPAAPKPKKVVDSDSDDDEPLAFKKTTKPVAPARNGNTAGESKPTAGKPHATSRPAPPKPAQRPEIIPKDTIMDGDSSDEDRPLVQRVLQTANAS